MFPICLPVNWTIRLYINTIEYLEYISLTTTNYNKPDLCFLDITFIVIVHKIEMNQIFNWAIHSPAQWKIEEIKMSTAVLRTYKTHGKTWNYPNTWRNIFWMWKVKKKRIFANFFSTLVVGPKMFQTLRRALEDSSCQIEKSKESIWRATHF